MPKNKFIVAILLTVVAAYLALTLASMIARGPAISLAVANPSLAARVVGPFLCGSNTTPHVSGSDANTLKLNCTSSDGKIEKQFDQEFVQSWVNVLTAPSALCLFVPLMGGGLIALGTINRRKPDAID